jgi:hypothetical protein
LPSLGGMKFSRIVDLYMTRVIQFTIFGWYRDLTLQKERGDEDRYLGMNGRMRRSACGVERGHRKCKHSTPLNHRGNGVHLPSFQGNAFTLSFVRSIWGSSNPQEVVVFHSGMDLASLAPTVHHCCASETTVPMTK